MHLAKSEGGDRCHFFKAEMQQAAQDRLELVQDLSLALELDQFSLVYQPVVNLRDGSVHKAEALLRWNHPERGFVSPARFIPLAEESGVIHALGDWVFHQAAEAVLTHATDEASPAMSAVPSVRPLSRFLILFNFVSSSV